MTNTKYTTEPAATKAIELIDKIRSTNNGYLFAPPPAEIALAKAHPGLFRVRHSPGATFPYQISLL